MFAQHQQEGLPTAGSTIGGKFEVVRLLGMGGMGAVFEARHLVTGKSVALKWLKATTAEEQIGVARFVREAQAAGRVHHPHVVDVYDVGQHGDGHFLVMELLRGESLSDRIERARLSLDEAVALLVPAIQAVGAAHRQGVVHRDLKPDNIFLCHNEDGSVWGPKVLDFGISKVTDTTSPSLTQSGTTLGTPHYMSPEQIRGLSDTDYRTDIYALGVILYESLSGNVPFDGESYGAIAIEIATASPTPLMHLRSDLPAAAGEIVATAMARSPGDRFQSADELAGALAALSSGAGLRISGVAPVLAMQEGRPPTGSVGLPASGVQPALRDVDDTETAAEPKSRALVWIAVATLLALVAMVVGGFMLSSSSAPPAAPTAAATIPMVAAPPTPPSAVVPTTAATPDPVPGAGVPTAAEAQASAAATRVLPTDPAPAPTPRGEAPPLAPTDASPGTSRSQRSTRGSSVSAAPTAPTSGSAMGRSGSLSSDDF